MFQRTLVGNGKDVPTRDAPTRKTAERKAAPRLSWCDKGVAFFRIRLDGDQCERLRHICEARTKNWRPFYKGRSGYAEWIADLLEFAEGDLERASIWIEAQPGDAGPELCERLDSLRLKLDHLKGMLAEAEASPEYVAAAGAAAASLAKALAIVERRQPAVTSR